MHIGDTLRKNLEFWHWYPRLLCQGLTEEQLHWQPENHPNNITFTLWHAYRCEDEVIHAVVAQQPSVFARDGWAKRLPVAETGDTAFGNGLDRQQIAAIRLDFEALMVYTESIGLAVQAYADSLSEADAAQQIPLPTLAETYPMLDSMSRLEMLTFFSVGHPAEHLGEVQYIKGLMGLQGAPL